jgi:hypothetical protein
MEGLNLEAIEKKRETELQQEILSGSLRQERLKKQLQECLRNRRQASATATSVDGGTSCRGATASRRSAGPEDDNTDDLIIMIIMIEMPFLRLRAEMGKLRTAMEKASKEYDQERELYAGLEEELSRFEIMLSSTVELFTVKDERKARTLAEWLGGLLGLYNTVKVKQIEHKEDSTRDALKTALVHLNAMDLHEK